MGTWHKEMKRGERFGYLVVLRRAGHTRRNGKKKYATWWCRCDCGQEVEVIGQRLRNGKRKACAVNGHFWRPARDAAAALQNKLTRASWRLMRERCLNPEFNKYSCYGGRGITVCERWLDFKNFLVDMGPRPSREYSIDRIDNNGNYEPGNCRWATRQQQAANRRNTFFVEYAGERMTLMELQKRTGVDRGRVYSRLANRWTLEDALLRPRLPRGRPRKSKPLDT